MQRADLGVLLTVQETMKHRPVLWCGQFSTTQKTVHWFQEQCSADCRVNVINYSPVPRPLGDTVFKIFSYFT